jgi:hypothetical protein
VGWRLWLWCSPRRPRPYCGEFGLRVGRLGLREYGTDFVVDRCQHAAIAQIGSAIGREFTHELLAVVATKPESELRSALEQLIGAGLIFARGTLPEATYLFKHALVQDVAHGTLLRRSRQELHARIADALERQFPETLESRPELSAYHLTRAGLVAKAVHFWLKAGERAAARSANKEAIAHLQAGINCLAKIADSPEKLRAEIDLNSAMVAVLQVTRGYGADLVVNTLNHVLELCRQTGDANLLAPVLFQTWLSNHMRANYCAGGSLAAELLEVAQKSDDPGAQWGPVSPMACTSLPREIWLSRISISPRAHVSIMAWVAATRPSATLLPPARGRRLYCLDRRNARAPATQPCGDPPGRRDHYLH